MDFTFTGLYLYSQVSSFVITVSLLADRLFCTLSSSAVNSQVVQLLVKRLDLHAVLLDLRLLVLSRCIPSSLLSSVESSLRDTYGDIKIGDLVGVLAGCWDFDWTGPVKVKVAERVCQLLQLILAERRLVQRYVEVSRQDAALVGPRWHHEEIEGA